MRQLLLKVMLLICLVACRKESGPEKPIPVRWYRLDSYTAAGVKSTSSKEVYVKDLLPAERVELSFEIDEIDLESTIEITSSDDGIHFKSVIPLKINRDQKFYKIIL